MAKTIITREDVARVVTLLDMLEQATRKETQSARIRLASEVLLLSGKLQEAEVEVAPDVFDAFTNNSSRHVVLLGYTVLLGQSLAS